MSQIQSELPPVHWGAASRHSELISRTASVSGSRTALSTVITVKAQLRCCSWPKDSCSSNKSQTHNEQSDSGVISFLSLCESQNATGSVRFGFLLLKDFSIIFIHLWFTKEKNWTLIVKFRTCSIMTKCALNRWMGAHVMSHCFPFWTDAAGICVFPLFPHPLSLNYLLWGLIKTFIPQQCLTLVTCKPLSWHRSEANV